MINSGPFSWRHISALPGTGQAAAQMAKVAALDPLVARDATRSPGAIHALAARFDLIPEKVQETWHTVELSSVKQ